MQSIEALTLLGFRASPGEESPAVSWRGGWQLRFDTHAAMHSAYATEPDCSVTFTQVDGPASIEFMCTPWSGMLQLTAEGAAPLVIDTYAPAHAQLTVDLPGQGVRDVTLQVLETRHRQAQDTQIWLHRLVLQRRPAWMTRHRLLTPSLTLVDGDFGTFLVLEKDRPVSHDIKHYGSWGAQQVKQFRALVMPGSTVADVGANLGHHTVVLSSLVGPSGTVLAFEPQRRVHRILQANLALNNCDNVRAYEFALGTEDAEAQMFPQDYDHTEWNVGGLSIATADGRLQFSEGGLAIQIRRLDDIPDARRLDFIKTDAQGFDFAVLKGAREVLQQARPIVVAEVAPAAMRAAGDDYEALYAYLEELGYRITDPDHPDFSLPPRRWSGKADEEWDILAVHGERADHLERVRAYAAR